MKRVSEEVKTKARERERVQLEGGDICSSCKRKNPPWAVFCVGCGGTFLTEEEMAPG